MKQALSKRENRHRRIRAKLKGGSIRPRISVFRSSKHISIQLIDDEKNKTLFGVSDIKIKKGTKTERAKNLGKEGARKILELGIKKVVFDRGGFRYHGRIKALAESLREGGLEF
ncbi:50S ribosomal protein L18 [Candidatus Giovannonibacteria bacterium RIFCSPHIGHO2_02_42_15]|uniref:Large ribosomal subunit protein uL18 n=2 Tax=Candidatus Giovannoniibacteriota TaxID=1752738 RepID=A0A1F5VQ36_9BACT|nr:MAG: 50S ribosomal protein L18 [Candidatus Giovannonibacteria bacterium GW2011_GWF2_42_19]OGF65171.1 MAG: 50S ribosomal protein L18 [Candidatus Giovannonibacteria bacterium RIFCSPHIGHO2_02_42_15]